MVSPIAQDAGCAAEETYEAMAPIYDAFTDAYDYGLWLGNLLPELERLGLRKGSLLDVGCGTGKSFLPMLEQGWSVTACDISPSMLELAQAKAGNTARLAVADMRKLPMFGEFDLVWALDDAVNYLLSAEEMRDALSGMRANLAPAGLLMFDVNTLRAYRSFFAEDHRVEQAGQQITWMGLTDPNVAKGSICEARVDSANGASEPHVHRQRHFSEAEVLDALYEVGLRCLKIFGHHHDAVLKQPLDEAAHMKAVYMVAAT